MDICFNRKGIQYVGFCIHVEPPPYTPNDHMEGPYMPVSMYISYYTVDLSALVMEYVLISEMEVLGT